MIKMLMCELKKIESEWKFFNYFQFADECVRTLGTKKILIDEEGFERWLKHSTNKDQERKNV